MSDKAKMVVVLSGGLDSTTLLYEALTTYRVSSAVSFNTSQIFIPGGNFGAFLKIGFETAATVVFFWTLEVIVLEHISMRKQ